MFRGFWVLGFFLAVVPVLVLAVVVQTNCIALLAGDASGHRRSRKK